MAWQWFEDFKKNAATKLARFNNSTFKEASIATCALMAAADGKVEPSEKTKVAKLISSSEMLQCFDGSELGRLFEVDCDMAGDEFKRIDLMRRVSKLKGNHEQADSCLKIALIIANADGDFADSEKTVVRELCTTLGLPAAEYLS